jgi:hypothetical protein
MSISAGSPRLSKKSTRIDSGPVSMQQLLENLGLKRELAQDLALAKLAFHHPVILAAGLVLLMPLAWWIIRRQRANLTYVSRGLRFALDTIRIGLIALLILVLADPYLSFNEHQAKLPVVPILIDASDSMHLSIGPFSSTEEAARWAGGPAQPVEAKKLEATERLAHVLSVLRGRAQELQAAAGDRFDLRYYFFDRGLGKMAENPDALATPPNPGVDASWIGSAIDQAIDRAGGRPLAGMLLISDGHNTGARPPIDAARSGGVPIYSVPAGNMRPLPDVAIVDVSAPATIASGDTALVTANIEAHGFAGRMARVLLKEGGKTLESREVVLPENGTKRLEFVYRPGAPGEHAVSVEALPQPEETGRLRANNSDATLIRVTDDRLRVLLVEGRPRWDYRFLRNAMRRDHGLAGRASAEPDVVLEAEWQRLPSRERFQLPRTIDDVASYHTVILGDASPDLLPEDFFIALGRAVRERGVGLVIASGPRYMPYAYTASLAGLLPVSISGLGREPPGGTEFRLELTPEGAFHDAMRFSQELERNRAMWSRLPPYYWCAAAERLLPGATPLAWNPGAVTAYGKVPVIATQRTGKGHVLFVGTDSTWLWRENEGDRLFYKFWGQAIRSVARAELDTHTTIEVQPARAASGDEVHVVLRGVAADQVPGSRQTAQVRIGNEEGGPTEVIRLSADPPGSGRFTAKHRVGAAGCYRLTHEGGTASCLLISSSAELRHTDINRAVLESLASASGGKMVELLDLIDALKRMPAPAISDSVHREMTLWDNRFLAIFIIFLYALDIGLRRFAGLS